MLNQIKKILNKRKISCETKLIKIKDLIESDVTKGLGFNKLVYLTNTELLKLKESYDTKIIENYIERLDMYMHTTGKEYNSHYRTMLNWMNKAGEKKKIKTYVCEYGNIHNEGTECDCNNF